MHDSLWQDTFYDCPAFASEVVGSLQRFALNVWVQSKPCDLVFRGDRVARAKSDLAMPRCPAQM